MLRIRIRVKVKRRKGWGRGEVLGRGKLWVFVLRRRRGKYISRF